MPYKDQDLRRDRWKEASKRYRDKKKAELMLQARATAGHGPAVPLRAPPQPVPADGGSPANAEDEAGGESRQVDPNNHDEPMEVAAGDNGGDNGENASNSTVEEGEEINYEDDGDGAISSLPSENGSAGSGIEGEGSSEEGDGDGEDWEGGADENVGELRTRQQVEAALTSLYNKLVTSHDLSIRGCQHVHSFILQNASAIHNFLQAGGTTCTDVQWLRIRQTAKMPQVRNTIYKKVLETNVAGREIQQKEELVGDFLGVPRETLKLDIVRNTAYVSLKELQAYFKQLPGHTGLMGADLSTVDIAIDGLPKAKSSSSTIIVFTIIWPKCGLPITYRAVEHRFGWTPTGDQVLAGFKEELEAANMTVRYLRSDAKERHVLLNMIQPSGRFGCDWCISCGYTKVFPSVTVHPAFDDQVGNSHIKDSQNCRRRTHAGVVAMARRSVEEGLDFPVENEGIRGPTAAHQLPGFNVVKGTALENMHASFEGAARRKMKATWNLDSKSKLPHPDVLVLNKYLREMKTPKEVTRNSREMDIAHWKAYEFWLFILHVVPAVVDGESVLVGERNLSRMYLLFAFLQRAVELPGRAFDELETSHNLDDLLSQWYRLVDEEFDHRHSVYNIHIVGTHLLEARRQLGPLFQVSSWPLEGIFKYVNSSYAGSTNVPKQIVTNMLLRERTHRCLKAPKKLRWNPTPSSKNDDSLAQTEDGNFVRLLEENADGSWRCAVLNVSPVCHDHAGLDFLDWEAVGVMRLEEETGNEAERSYRTSQFVAKAVVCKHTISTMPVEWIYETVQ